MTNPVLTAEITANITANLKQIKDVGLRRAVFNAETSLSDTVFRLSRCADAPCVAVANEVLNVAKDVLARGIEAGLGDDPLYSKDIKRSIPESIEELEAVIAAAT